MKIRASLLWIATLPALLAAGCGDDTIDASSVEKQIEAQLSTATAEVASVSCPDDVEEEEGARFTCDAKLNGGGKAQVEVLQTSDSGDFRYSVKPGTLVLADDKVEPALEEDLASQGLPETQVDCPATMAVKEGGKVTCTATGSGGRETTLTFTFSSSDGTIDDSSIETSGT